MIAPSSHISAAAGFQLDQIFRFDESFWTSEKHSNFSQASAREASKVEALPEARRGSSAVVEATASSDLRKYNSCDHEKKSPTLLKFAAFPRPEKGNCFCR